MRLPKRVKIKTFRESLLNNKCPFCKNELISNNENSVYFSFYYCKNCSKYHLVQFENDLNEYNQYYNDYEKACVLDEKEVEKSRIFSDLNTTYISALLNEHNCNGILGFT